MSEQSRSFTGLCATCRYGRFIPTPRSEFLLCERSKTEPRYPRYPRLPVLECTGFERMTRAARDDGDPAGGGSPK